MKIIAKIETDFPEKFGLPRQSGLVPGLWGRIVFEPPYRNGDAVRGLEGYSYIWVLWKFSGAERETWSPTVRPPKLGGNTRVGVFATRSPFRPNPIGLSSVRLEKIQMEEGAGPVLYVSGIDMMDQTPIYDIKPYLPYVDCHPEALGGFTDRIGEQGLEVQIPEEMLASVPKEKRQPLLEVLAEDPRPSYQKDARRVYGMDYAGFEVKFRVEDGMLMVLSIEARSIEGRMQKN